MTDTSESTVVPGKQMRVILFDLHNLQTRLKSEQQRREKVETENTRLRTTLGDILLVVNEAAEQGPAVCEVRVIATRALLGRG